MRVAGTKPEAERCLFVGSLGEESREAFFVNLSGGVVFEEFPLEFSGAEGLAPGTGVVAGFFEKTGIGFH